MLEVNGIKNGVVIDHIPAGKGLKVFSLLFSDMEDPMVLLMNVKSNVLGKKDIIKIENVSSVNLELLGLISQSITVNYIVNDALTRKVHVKIPETITGGLKCSNPRCITHSDDYAIPTFKLLSSNGKAEYECNYCEEITVYRL
ncbi:aspartate carbamoyltransferase regulatory subunit [Fusibacter tunisiensis]|jgi:aspartate carbamoyltransferase regulatory subunit|uniref:Aspartate carbamoyltransferase regulatory subunit n=1 Tax=Fusibacter tunisiensis TaxID=1008308 RepID=A0ABS2MR48_9FIRM|nr:aspartate carbamoyltransferase regulatory subunit [Fusibacter tunisiensis]MBM7561837.1 aspartate carbamoyltransferase regulatory subunit [Fusibacter tunisiensis]